jgi:glyoxylase I family protein
MKIKSIAHIEFTVTNLQASKKFYEKLPGFKVVAEYPHFIMFSCANFLLGLTDHKDSQTVNRFNEFNVGLDHVSFSVSSYEDLEEAKQFFDNENIPHGEINKLSNGAFDIAFRDPDNIQLEYTWKE